MAIHRNWCIFSKSNRLQGKSSFGCVSSNQSGPAKHKIDLNYRRESLNWNNNNKTSQRVYEIMYSQATNGDLH